MFDGIALKNAVLKKIVRRKPTLNAPPSVDEEKYKVGIFNSALKIDRNAKAGFHEGIITQARFLTNTGLLSHIVIKMVHAYNSDGHIGIHIACQGNEPQPKGREPIADILQGICISAHMI